MNWIDNGVTRFLGKVADFMFLNLGRGTIVNESDLAQALMEMCIRDRGKEPRPPAKVPKCVLSGKGCGNSKTTRWRP